MVGLKTVVIGIDIEKLKGDTVCFKYFCKGILIQYRHITWFYITTHLYGLVVQGWGLIMDWRTVFVHFGYSRLVYFQSTTRPE